VVCMFKQKEYLKIVESAGYGKFNQCQSDTVSKYELPSRNLRSKSSEMRLKDSKTNLVQYRLNRFF
jgi:hypothetical protein